MEAEVVLMTRFVADSMLRGFRSCLVMKLARSMHGWTDSITMQGRDHLAPGPLNTHALLVSTCCQHG